MGNWRRSERSRHASFVLLSRREQIARQGRNDTRWVRLDSAQMDGIAPGGCTQPPGAMVLSRRPEGQNGHEHWLRRHGQRALHAFGAVYAIVLWAIDHVVAGGQGGVEDR